MTAAVVGEGAQGGSRRFQPGRWTRGRCSTSCVRRGFPQRDETDRASGRGVGMAVVKETIEELSGTLTLDTEPGEGTRYIIQLPVTLAIADALIGRVGSESFAVPQGAVREVIDVAAADIRQLEENEIMPYRDGALPLIRLSRLFGIASAADGPLSRVRRRHRLRQPRARRRPHRRAARNRRPHHRRSARACGRRFRARPISATAASC